MVGEIADMMLEGAMCQWCGEFIENATGFATICAGCRSVHGVDIHGIPRKKKRNRKSKRKQPRGGAEGGGDV